MFTITLTRQQLYELYYQGPRPTLNLIEQLFETLADWERILGAQQQLAIDSLEGTVRRLTAQVERLKEQLYKEQGLNYQLTSRLQELQAELARRDEPGRAPLDAAQVRRDSHNSSLPPSVDLPGAKAANSIKRTRSLRRRTGRRVGGQPGHRGVTLQRVEQPDAVVVHAPEVCRGCAASLAESPVVGSEWRQVFDIPPVKVEVTEHRAQTRRCEACGVRTKGEFPREVKAPVQYGQHVRARAVYLHKYQLLPFARTSEAMKELFGCAIAPGTLHTTRARCAAKLVGTEQRIKAAIKASDVIGADETGLRVAGTGGWVHVARTDGLTHYGYDARRSKAAVDAIGILPTFTGMCVRDGWAAYDEYRTAEHALCNAHLLRELIYVGEVCAEQLQWTQPLIKSLLEIKTATQRARSGGEEKLADDHQARFFSRYDRLIRRATRLNPPPKEEKPDPLAKRFKVVRVKHRSPVRPLIRRLQDKRAEVLRFMTDLRVPFDNNGAERDIRMIKLQQKVSGCFRTEEGATAFCRIRSYLSTARKQGHRLLTALERVFAGKPLAISSLSRPE